MSIVKYQEGRIGFVQLDSLSVNTINQSVRSALVHAVEWAEKEALSRVVFSVNGADHVDENDLGESVLFPKKPCFHDIATAIELSEVPWVAAIQGSASGVEAEIALACRARVMQPESAIAFPEVMLGLIPQAGSMQRLARLVGLEKAIDIIIHGKPVPAIDALAAQLVQAIEKDPVEASVGIVIDTLLAMPASSQITPPLIDENLFAVKREHCARKLVNQNAPQKALDVIEAGLAIPFEEALILEREAYLSLIGSQQSAALRHLYTAERAAKLPKNLTAQPVLVEQVAVVGGGTMGAGIAYALLGAGCSVIVLEVDDEKVNRAYQSIEKIMQSSLRRGLLSEVGLQECINRLQVTTQFDKAKAVNLVIEAAYESMEIKKDLFRSLSEVVHENTILATNTSYLDINELAQSIPNPARVIGLHFFAPAHIMKLLEIVQGDATHAESLATGYAIAHRLQKVPVVSGVCDGFIGNRILARYREAADTLLLDGSTPIEIDQAMVHFGYAMGPYEAQDLSGLDIAYANRRRQDATRDPNRRYISVADVLVEQGRLGRKTGRGWYNYTRDHIKCEDPYVLETLHEVANAAGICRQRYKKEEIIKRLLLAMINEAANILYEGIARSAKDIDLVTVHGYGFPRWRGGLMHYADSLGINNLAAELQLLEKEDSIAWKVSPLIMDCFRANTTLARGVGNLIDS